MRIQNAYQTLIDSNTLTYDPGQQQAITALDKILEALTTKKRHPFSHTQIQGLYLWGDVGRGKTLLMDLFYNNLKSIPKKRLHFHRFMALIHRELTLLSGKRDPLKKIAKHLAKDFRILCLDEFFVLDIGDAMILAGLFNALFEQDIILVATSNIQITALYKNGLQRERFMPTITLLQHHTEEIHLNGEQDHRLRALQFYQTYFLIGEINFGHLFQKIINDKPEDNKYVTSSPLFIRGRQIETVKHTATCLWLSFDALCKGPRSQLDYIDIASQFTHILLSDIPALGATPKNVFNTHGIEDTEANPTHQRQFVYAINDDSVRRFISLIDELYDQGVHLYLSAEVPLQTLYAQGSLNFEFKRTISRLKEMQSKEYLTRQKESN